jgi:steroid 5-alpha reductase family enzyme
MRHMARSKRGDLVLVTAVYVVAILASVIAFRSLDHLHPLVAVLLVDLGATLAIYATSVAVRNNSIYDPYWSVAPPLIAWAYAASGTGVPDARVAITIVAVSVWAVRLTTNWARGWPGMHHEDWRYPMLRERSGMPAWVSDLGAVHLLPTMHVWLGSLGLYAALTLGTNEVGPLDVVGALVIVAAAIVQFVADEQLRSHRRTGTSEPCRRGLWALSRHPNYFGEASMWWGVWLLGVAGNPSSWWWTLIGPVSMTALLRGISVPMMDDRSVARRPGYEQLMRELPAMLPIGRRLRRPSGS